MKRRFLAAPNVEAQISSGILGDMSLSLSMETITLSGNIKKLKTATTMKSPMGLMNVVGVEHYIMSLTIRYFFLLSDRWPRPTENYAHPIAL